MPTKLASIAQKSKPRPRKTHRIQRLVEPRNDMSECGTFSTLAIVVEVMVQVLATPVAAKLNQLMHGEISSNHSLCAFSIPFLEHEETNADAFSMSSQMSLLVRNLRQIDSHSLGLSCFRSKRCVRAFMSTAYQFKISSSDSVNDRVIDGCRDGADDGAGGVTGEGGTPTP